MYQKVVAVVCQTTGIDEYSMFHSNKEVCVDARSILVNVLTEVANMCKADFLKSSVPNEQYQALYVKDTIDDPDAPDGTTMRRWYVTMIAAGIPIEWDEML